MKNKSLLSAIVLAALAAPAAFLRACRFGFGCPHFANGLEIGAGTHQHTTTKFTAVAIATRHCLYKFDSTDPTGKRIVVCGLQDRAIFAVPDEVSATDLTNRSPFPIESIMLGVTSKSVRMIANAALTPGTVVYPTTLGYVDSYANIGTGSNYPCGIVIVGSTAQGQIIEVMSTVDYAVATA